MTQRLIAAVSAPTAEGCSTNSTCGCGPQATRARWQPISGPSPSISRGGLDLGAHGADPCPGRRGRRFAAPRIAAEIRHVGAPRDANQDRGRCRRDARDDREGEAAARRWDIKLIPGGLIDLELSPRSPCSPGAGGGRPEKGPAHHRHPSASRAAPRRRGRPAARWSRGGGNSTGHRHPADPAVPHRSAGPRRTCRQALADMLLAATDLPDIRVLEAHLTDTAKRVRTHFDRLLGSKGRKSA